MRSEDLREFAQRPHAGIAVLKREHWRTVAQSGDELAAFEAAQALREHAMAVSDFPSVAYLTQDFAHHVRLKQLIDRASQAATVARAAG